MSLQGDLHCYLQKNGRLDLPKAVRYALDIARYEFQYQEELPSGDFQQFRLFLSVFNVKLQYQGS